jgi:hypothetical protein
VGLRADQTSGFDPRTVQPVASRILTTRLINMLVKIYPSLYLFYIFIVNFSLVLSVTELNYDSYSAY